MFLDKVYTLSLWLPAMLHCYYPHQVVPIYGRGGVQEDPRGKHKPGVRTQQIESLQAVPRRPAGQRPAPTSVSCSTALQYVGNFALFKMLSFSPAITNGLHSTF